MDALVQQNNTINNILPKVVKDIGMNKGVEVIDLNSALKDYPEMFPDMIHPSVKGYMKIAQVVFDQIKIRIPY